MDDQQRLRYSRHLLLDDWSEAAQERLLAAHALVIGAGGLGSPALMYLASAGVGRITVMDHDTVDLTNLQRQIIHTTERVGQPKVASAAQSLAALNPEIQVVAIPQAADEALLGPWVAQAQVVLDCTDRFDTRQLINRMCMQAGVPLVSAAAVRWDGQLAVYDPRDAQSPCYACVFPPNDPPPEVRCATMGVFAPLVGTMGVMQAGEAIKLLAALPLGASQAGRLLMLDGRTWQTTTLKLARDPHCPVCASSRLSAHL